MNDVGTRAPPVTSLPTQMDEGACYASIYRPGLSRSAPASVGRAANLLPSADFDSGVYVPINDRVLASTQGTRVVANGNAAFSFAPASLTGTINDDETWPSCRCLR